MLASASRSQPHFLKGLLVTDPDSTTATLTFYWNGRPLRAYAGDTVAAALWRNGIATLGFSRKRHRPLGVSGSHLQGELLHINGVPHVRASTCLVLPQMDVRQQNVWPHARLNLLRLMRLLPASLVRGGIERSNLFPGGTRRFDCWERLLMHLAGETSVGPKVRAAASPATGRLLSVDTAVVGGGRFGREAANDAARRGAATVLVSPSTSPGLRSMELGIELPALDPAITVLEGHAVVGLYRRGRVLVAAPKDGLRPATAIAACNTVLATGRRSCPPLVPGHDLPGVMDLHTALDLARTLEADLGPAVIVGTGAEQILAESLRGRDIIVAAVARIQDLSAIMGRGRVSAAILAGRVVPCRALVHAGPWMSDPSLSFQASASGTLRLSAQHLPEAVRVVGSAALADEPVYMPNIWNSNVLAVCSCMDVTAAEIFDFAKGGEKHIEVLKRATGCGMGPCQGFPCWALARAVLKHANKDADPDDRPSHRPPRAGLTVRQAAGLDGLVELG
jgi:sarcosine oxidase subunit alpha